jgi:anti-anti-sigma factor
VYRSPEVERARTGAWITTALSRGQRVLYKHAGTDDGARAQLTELAGPAALDSGDLELVDAAALHAETGGDPPALQDWHATVVARARREGYAGVAVTCDGTALRVIAPDPDAMLAHERDLTALSSAEPVTVLCRYDARAEQAGTLEALLGTHAPGVEDVSFAAVRRTDLLAVAGAIDASNAYRFAAVLHTAVADGIRVLDLGELEFLGAAGLHALEAALLALAEDGEVLIARNASRTVRRALNLSGLSEAGRILCEG